MLIKLLAGIAINAVLASLLLPALAQEDTMLSVAKKINEFRCDRAGCRR